MAEYSVDFQVLAAQSGWGDKALQGVFFFHGLADYVKDELAARDSASSLDELVSLAIRWYNRLHERRREKAGHPHAPIFQARPSLPVPVERASSSSPAPRPTPSWTSEEPMQLGRSRLTLAERQCRIRAGLCIYCGLSGHSLVACPQLPKD